MYSPPLSDTETQRMITAQASAAQALGVYLDGPHVWGWAGRTLGQRALHPQRGACWLRVLSAPVDKASGKLWEGTLMAAELIPASVRRPQLLAVRDHTADGLAFRAELTEFIPAPVMSPDPVLRHEPSLTAPFLEQLRRDLQTVAQTQTDRVAVRQEWIDRRVPELTGVPAPRIHVWECAHGDLHPANLTTTGYILNWEGFGLAPRHYDAAMLYAYSLLAPHTAARILDVFAEDLNTDDGRAALLVVAADLLLSASRGDHPDLVPALRELVQRSCRPTG